MSRIEEENDYLTEMMLRINNQCNQVLYDGYSPFEAIKNIKNILVVENVNA